MYEQVETDKPFVDCKGLHINPIATLADQYGGRVQITEDDHQCIVCYLTHFSVEYIAPVQQVEARYEPITGLFPELFEFLKTLKTPVSA